MKRRRSWRAASPRVDSVNDAKPIDAGVVLYLSASVMAPAHAAARCSR